MRNKNLELYEIVVVPHEPALTRDLELRFNTFEQGPDAALLKVKQYLQERNHIALKFAMDFIVNKQRFIE